MTADPFWNNVRSLFQSAAELPAHERAAFLDRECRDGSARIEVESLLEAHDNAGTFLEQSIWELIDANDPHRLAGTAVGPYRLVRPLGHGGMGTVFLAVRADADFDQRVAIKLVRGGSSGEELVRRFRQERQILAALEHPNIARLLDGGTTTDGLPYLVMEYVDGIPVDEFGRSLSRDEKLRLFLQLCDAVQHAHRSLVIHRDLKPGNVLVTRDGTLKLLDFGIAKLTSQVSETVTRLMTPEYASPEQLAGLPVTTASDVYSLGVMLRELLDTTARGDLATIVSTALESEPARRYASVEKFADDIRNYLAGRPIAARPATFVYRASKFVRRNKLGVAAVLAIVIITTISFAATLHQKRMAERRFDEVRSLAHSVVFELHDAIATLPGSTPARALLVKRALVYLDHLAEESSDNTPLQLELARAYLKIGDVQGLPYSANLGDTAGALRSYRKSLSIAQGVPAGEEASMILADAHDRIGFVEERALHWPVALREHQAALAIRAHIPHGVEADFAEARTLVSIGDCMYVGEHQIPASLRTPPHTWYERSLQVLARIPPNANRARLLHDIARAHQHLGSVWSHEPYDFPRAIVHHDAALQALEECMRLEPGNATARRNFADQLVMKATAQNAMGDVDGVIAGTRRALPILADLAAADPKNSEAQHDLAFAQEQLALGLIRVNRYAEARKEAEQVLAIREKLIAADPTNREDRRDMMRTYSILTQIETAAGHDAAAAELQAKARAINREVAR